MTDNCTYLGHRMRPCCAKTVKGRAYCEQHLWMVYQKGTATQRKKDIRVAAAVWDLESEFNAAVQELIDEGYDFGEDRWEVKDTVD